ncbi:cob(I)yrinic acid a,c-diamide adenosyltransferase [Candidatus Woesearchaeota archaeon]|nr:cob(I)yrinic acid a,c-diamide adenosyltransferase [Candidatus Woesearchaeota archaeon]
MTCILGSGRVPKDNLMIEALGDFDELSCALGVAAAFSDDKAAKKTLENIQNDLHTVCAEISGCGSPGYPLIKRMHIAELEEAIAKIERAVGEQRTFLLPGGSMQAAFIHLGRAVARRAERSLVRLSKKQKIRNELLTYANRLSTLLYVLARLQNRMRNLDESRPVYRHQG